MDEEEFRKILNPAQYRVLREKGTEEAFSGKYNEHRERGIYSCAACGNFLFLSIHKFDARNGWPAFKKPISKRNVVHSMIPGEETEIICKECGSHLGLIKKDDETSYYSINSIALDFHELPEIEWDSDDDESKEKQSSQKANQSPINVTNVTLLAGGIVLGAGAASVILSMQAATLLCQNLAATSTPVAAAVTEQVTLPPTNPPTSGAQGGTPRNNAQVSPAQSAILSQPSATGAGTSTDASAGSGSADGTI